MIIIYLTAVMCYIIMGIVRNIDNQNINMDQNTDSYEILTD